MTEQGGNILQKGGRFVETVTLLLLQMGGPGYTSLRMGYLTKELNKKGVSHANIRRKIIPGRMDRK